MQLQARRVHHDFFTEIYHSFHSTTHRQFLSTRNANLKKLGVFFIIYYGCFGDPVTVYGKVNIKVLSGNQVQIFIPMFLDVNALWSLAAGRFDIREF